MHFCKTFWEISEFFNISHIFNFWKMLFRSFKKVCEEFSNIKNLRCTFFLFFRADRRGIWLFFRIQNCLVVNWPRKWAVLHLYKNSKISQNVLQKSATFKNDFLFFGRVKNLWVRAHHFGPQTFCRGILERLSILWSLLIINGFFWSFARKSECQVPVKI